ncbi:VOC family protein [Pinisolibacter sp.]|uniref:VOC family protein n=1 Tax=Pinisolibacter sp. TaxID=2172024 RepID=UPI002FDE966F
MRLAHVALWTTDLDAAARFWAEHFAAEIGETYVSKNRPGFCSRFAHLPDGTALELMSGPWLEGDASGERPGWAHLAISLGSAAAVDAAARRFADQGLLVSGPRHTGDGFYEAVVRGPDGALIEITS